MQTKEERQRLAGPGLLIVDSKLDAPTSEEQLYLTDGGEAGVQITAGGQLNGAAALAQVLFCCRPPSGPINSAATETAELLQV